MAPMRQDGVSLPAPSGFAIHRLKASKGDELIVTQLLAMEKKLWKKTDSWGGLLEKELTRRNTFTLYATTLPLSSSAPPVIPSSSSSSEVVGYLIFTATGLVCHISKVVVVPEVRRQGLGRALVQAAVEIAKKERRVGSITLHVDADNTPALGLYSSLGFESEGKLEDYYSVGRHAHKMRQIPRGAIKSNNGGYSMFGYYNWRDWHHWQVITFSRRQLEFTTFKEAGQHDQEKRIFQVHANLLEKNDVERSLKEALVKKLQEVGPIGGLDPPEGGSIERKKEGKEGKVGKDGTIHVRIFHCAYIESGQNAVEDCKLNSTMLKNIVEAVENESNTILKHVFTMEGTKWYGQQFLEPLKTPFNESDGRHIGPNFYYDLEDYLRSRTGTTIDAIAVITRKTTTPTTTTTTAGNKVSWTWSALRPGPVIGYSTGSYMSLLPTIAVYGSLCKELVLEMRFPGTHAAYTAIMEVCNADVLAEGMVFVSTTPEAENQAFNINNGDFFRWEQVWPRLADWFGVEAGPPLKVGDLTLVMGEYKNVWEGLVKKHGLQDIPYEKLATWKFMSFVFSMPASGWFSNTLKLRKAGFHGMVVDSCESMIEKLEILREHKIIP